VGIQARSIRNPSGSLSRAAKLARRDAIIAEWTKDIGGEAALSAAERDLLRKAADLMQLRATRAEDQVRIANSVSKILAQCGLVNRRDKRRNEESFTEALARHKQARDQAGQP